MKGNSNRNSFPPIRQEATELVLALPSLLNPKVEALDFVAYSPVRGIENRILADAKPAMRRILVQAVQSLKINKAEIAYWESSMLAATWMALDPDHFMREALRHFPPSKSERSFKILVTDLTRRRLRKESIMAKSRNEVIALCSRCKLADGSIAQIPMMDFRCRPSAKNLKRLKKALRKLGQNRGVIMNSGNSYHYYGFDILPQNTWVEFLAGCLLLSPFTDSRFIAHRLAEGLADLRITKSEVKRTIPYVVSTMQCKSRNNNAEKRDL